MASPVSGSVSANSRYNRKGDEQLVHPLQIVGMHVVPKDVTRGGHLQAGSGDPVHLVADLHLTIRIDLEGSDMRQLLRGHKPGIDIRALIEKDGLP